jgi:predicted NBD/HSP70 family sugar kinase
MESRALCINAFANRFTDRRSQPMATPKLIRHIHQAQALQLLKEHGELSRAEFARYLQLNRASVTHLAGDLIKQGLIIETGEAFVTQATGRPGVGLKLNPDGALFIGIRIGKEAIDLVVINLAGAIVHRDRLRLDSDLRPQTVLNKLITLINNTWTHRFDRTERIKGAGIAIAALMGNDGIVRAAPLMGWRDVEILPALRAALPFPVIADNDANAAALAELSFGSCIGESHVALFHLDVGVGAGLILGGRIYRGANGFAGELGHLAFNPRSIGKPEGKGFLETKLGKEELLKAYHAASGKHTSLNRLIKKLERNEAAAIQVTKLWSQWLGVAIRNMADLFDPAKIVLAGPLSTLYRWAEKDVLSSLHSRRFPTVESLQIIVSPLGDECSTLGGAALAYSAIFSLPNVGSNGPIQEAKF